MFHVVKFFYLKSFVLFRLCSNPYQSSYDALCYTEGQQCDNAQSRFFCLMNFFILFPLMHTILTGRVTRDRSMLQLAHKMWADIQRYMRRSLPSVLTSNSSCCSVRRSTPFPLSLSLHLVVSVTVFTRSDFACLLYWDSRWNVGQ
jgi:hypothetical protein